jgi:MFS family permease
MYRNIPNVMIADLVGPADCTRAFSTLRIGVNIGFALGPVLGGLVAMYSYTAMFAAAVVASAVYLVITVFLMRDTKPRHPVPAKPINDNSVWGRPPVPAIHPASFGCEPCLFPDADYFQYFRRQLRRH